MMIFADVSGEDSEGQVREEGRGLKTCGVWKHVFKQIFFKQIFFQTMFAGHEGPTQALLQE